MGGGTEVDASGFPAGRPAERRYLTIGFCDLVGYTELSEQLDPEELRIVQTRYQNLVLEIVERHGGFVARFSGDGILLYFGYPTAHENDAERAVRGALEVAERVPRMASGLTGPEIAPLSIRIGIHTGLVVVGSEMSSGGRADHGVVGEPVNLAARLQAEAPPNGVVVSGETRNLIEGLFETEPLGPRRLKGLRRLIQVYRVMGARPVSDRIHSRLRRGALEIVGRKEYLDQLMQRWQTVNEQSCCQTVYVVGEAGIGKTRLILEFAQSAPLANAAVLQISCHEFLAHTPLHSVASLLWTRAGLLVDDSADVKTEKLSTFLRELGLDSPGNLEIATSLVVLLLPGSPQTTVATALLKQRQFDFLLSMLERIAREWPTLLWIDDAHWLDPSTAEFLSEGVVRLRNAPILIILTLRSGAQTARLPAPQAVASLRQLQRAEAMTLARSIPGAHGISDELITIAVEASDGIPLFIEQLVLSIVSNEQRHTPGLARTDLPLTLAEVVSARLDQLGDGRRIVQAASCIGRTFTPTLLGGVLSNNSADVTKALETLVAAEILIPRHEGAESCYEFRHGLIERAARDSMLQIDRKAMHARIAETLRRQPILPLPEIVAHHLTAAEEFAEAAVAWLEAAAAAAKRSAHIEAIDHTTRGIAAARQIQDSSVRRTVEIKLQAGLIGPLIASSGPTSTQLEIACRRGIELCSEGEPNPLIFAFTFGQFVFANCRGHIVEALSLARTFLSLAEQYNFVSGTVVGHRLVGICLLSQGDAEQAVAHLQQSLDLYVPERDAATTDMFGQNTQVHSQSLLSLAFICLGDVEQSLTYGMDALAAADAVRNPQSTVLAISYFGCFVMGLADAIAPMLFNSRRVIDLCQKHKLQTSLTHGQAFLGWALCRDGDFRQGISFLEQAIADFDRANYRLSVTAFLAALGDARRRCGDMVGADAIAARALEIVESGSDRWLEPEVRRIAGLVMRDAGRGGDAETMLRAAVACAAKLRFPLFEQRALQALQETLGSNVDPDVELRLHEMSRWEDVATKVTTFANANALFYGEPRTAPGGRIAASARTS